MHQKNPEKITPRRKFFNWILALTLTPLTFLNSPGCNRTYRLEQKLNQKISETENSSFPSYEEWKKAVWNPFIEDYNKKIREKFQDIYRNPERYSKELEWIILEIQQPEQKHEVLRKLEENIERSDKELSDHEDSPRLIDPDDGSEIKIRSSEDLKKYNFKKLYSLDYDNLLTILRSGNESEKKGASLVLALDKIYRKKLEEDSKNLMEKIIYLDIERYYIKDWPCNYELLYISLLYPRAIADFLNPLNIGELFDVSEREKFREKIR